MNSAFAPWTFRFRGSTARILAIVACFRAEPNVGLAPGHIGRQIGLSLYDTVRILDRTPELFVKLPGRRDGITRYRLASSVAVREAADIEALVQRHARRESWLFYAFVAMAALVLVVAIMAIAPALF